MKKIAVSGLFLFLLVFMSCNTDGSGANIDLLDFITMKSSDAKVQNWKQATSFSKNEDIGFAIVVENPDGNLTKFVLTVKKDGAVYDIKDYPFSNNSPKFTLYFSNSLFINEIGNYTGEVYAVDKNGNHSNTRNTSFEVK